MTLNDYLQDLGEQGFLEEKKLEVRKNPKVEELYRKYVETINLICHITNDANKSHAGDSVSRQFLQYMKLVRDLTYSSKDVTDLSLYIKEDKTKKHPLFSLFLGSYLSALVNNSEEENFTIFVPALDTEAHDIGCFNTKNLTVFGNVFNPAYEMKSGTLTIHGKPTNSVGLGMEGGKIILKGDISAGIGNSMKGGEIQVINGSVSDHGRMGNRMHGGKIIIDGDVNTCVGSGMTGGEIIIKGNLTHPPQFFRNQSLGGKIVVNGNAKGTAYFLDGGEIVINGDIDKIDCSGKGIIRVEGNIEEINNINNEIKLYHKGKRVGHSTLSRFYYNNLRKNEFIRKHFG